MGATQRKLPEEHFTLLRVLGALELLAFPLLGAGISTYEPASQAWLPGHVLWMQSVLFAAMAACIVISLQVTEDLRSPTSGLYSIDEVLGELVSGLRAELDRRLACAPPVPQISAEHWGVPSASPEAADHLPRRDRKAWQRALEPQSEDNSLQQRLMQCALVGLGAAVLLPLLAELLRAVLSPGALQAIREDNNAQWLQNFFTGIGFIFSLLVAQTFGFLYGQQEAIYMALYSEVSEAKALLEQLSLVCRGRPAYCEMLCGLRAYVQNDLQKLDSQPSQLLVSRTTEQDPLESVLYLTSVGEPSSVYNTVRGLRQARGARLGATQRKLPEGHFWVLNTLGVLELSVFPVLAAGCWSLYPPGSPFMGSILAFHSLLFGLMVAAMALTLTVLRDLWSPVGETYNIRAVLAQMVSGLEEELELRLAGAEPPPNPAPVPTPQALGH